MADHGLIIGGASPGGRRGRGNRPDAGACAASVALGGGAGRSGVGEGARMDDGAEPGARVGKGEGERAEPMLTRADPPPPPRLLVSCAGGVAGATEGVASSAT